MENQENEKRYKAFISYSHANNQGEGRKWADWLHHALETYETPEDLIGKKNKAGQEIPRQIYPVFQDEKELSASSSLSNSLTSALDNSEFLIYLSSPRSAKSTYVRDEIRYFKQTGKSKQVMALIISGEPEYGEVQTDAQCFPPELRFHVDADGKVDETKPEEVLAADVRIPHSQEEGFTSAEALRRQLHDNNVPQQQIKAEVEEYKKRLDLALLKIISGILGVPLGELTKRDQAYQMEKMKQKNRNIKRIATAISALAIMAIIAGIFAWNQRNSALRNLAKSLYTSGINKLTESEYGDGAAYIAEATRRGDESAKLFANSMLAVQEDLTLMPNMNYGNLRFSPKGKWLVGFANVGGFKNVLQVWDAVNRKFHRQVDSIYINQIRYPLFDAQQRVYVTAKDRNNIVRYDIEKDKEELLRANQDSSFVYNLAVSPNGKYVIFIVKTAFYLLDTETKSEQLIWNMPQYGANSAYFSSNSKNFVLSHTPNSDLTTVKFFDIQAGNAKELTEKSLNSSIAKATFSDDGNQILVNNLDGLYAYNFSTGASWASLRPINGAGYQYAGFVNKELFAGSGNSISRLDPNSGRVLKSSPLPENLFYLSKLNKIIENDPSNLDFTSPDWTQTLVSNNKQTFIENVKSLPLNLAQFFGPKDMKIFIPGQLENEALISYKNKKQIDKINLDTQEKTEGFIRIPEVLETMMVLYKSKHILVKGASGKTYIFDAATGKQKGTPFATQAKLYLFNADQSQVLTRTSQNSFAAWDVATGKQLLTYEESKLLVGFSVSSDFTKAIIVEPGKWRVVDIASKKVLKEGKENLSSGKFNPAGKHLVLVEGNGNTQVLETQNFQPILKLKTIEFPFITFNNKGNVMAISEDANHMRLWDLDKKKSFGQNIRVSKTSTNFHFTEDDQRIIIQDDTDNLNYVVKVIDAKTGNILTMPFINQRFDRMYIMPGDKNIMTWTSLMEGNSIHIWEIPGLVDINKDKLTNDLELFYGKKYDEETGSILPYVGNKADFNTWYFEDPYTRTVSPNSNNNILDVLRKNYPIKNDANLQILGVAYNHHPLSRAMLAVHFSKHPEQKYLGKRLLAVTEIQLAKIKDKGLKTEVENLLKEAKQNLNK